MAIGILRSASSIDDHGSDETLATDKQRIIIYGNIL